MKQPTRIYAKKKTAVKLKKKCVDLFLFLILVCLGSSFNNAYSQLNKGLDTNLTLSIASKLASLPLKCMEREFPYKSAIVVTDSSLIKHPKEYDPSFYGCYDWHSSVHGHWMLIKLLKVYPDMPEKDVIRKIMNDHLSKEKIAKEVLIFKSPANKSFERTYGWAWLLQLQNELLTWNDADAKRWAQNVQPLADLLSKNLIDYLPKLSYAIRAGEHTNLAFGLRLSYDYGMTVKDTGLISAIKKASMLFYFKDKNYSFDWEPSGNDFLSPGLEEAALMTRILTPDQYTIWLKAFLPQFFDPKFKLAPGIVKDRTDAKLVHLDGLNLSRGWCFKEIIPFLDPKVRPNLTAIMNDHMLTGMKYILSGNYEGEHWLASFAVYSLTK